MVLAKSCGITLVCAALSLQVGSSEKSLMQRLREWCYDAQDKKGDKRRELDVSACFAPLWHWILAWWPADQPRLALVLDATTLKKRFTVLVILLWEPSNWTPCVPPEQGREHHDD
jgi:hypothetical protein